MIYFIYSHRYNKISCLRRITDTVLYSYNKIKSFLFTTAFIQCNQNAFVLILYQKKLQCYINCSNLAEQTEQRKTQINWLFENMACNWQVIYCSQLKPESFHTHQFSTLIVIHSNALLTLQHSLWTMLSIQTMSGNLDNKLRMLLSRYHLSATSAWEHLMVQLL